MLTNVQSNKISGLSQILLIIASLCLGISIFIPIWRIELDAPQYPEGLYLEINANGLGGNVDIINGLNHYIGMKTLHNEDFIEFKILPYLIAFFAFVCLLIFFTKQKKALFALLIAFVLFGIVAMIDFWKWEYNYGHNLDPNAAIIVPGMAYQPPLIGFKQLLNFGAYSIPALGGWLFISSGLLLLFASIREGFFSWVLRKNKINATGVVALTFAFSSCGSNGPDAIKLNVDACDYCKMTISNEKFAAEILTSKGRVYKFDDLSCMINYKKENSEHKYTFYVSDFLSPNKLLKADSLFYVQSEDVNSPMGGNTAAFANSDSASAYLLKLNGIPTNWKTFNH